VSTQLLSYAPGGVPETFQAFFRDRTGIHPWKAPARGLGNAVQYAGSRAFILHRSQEDFSARSPKRPMASVTLPEKADNILILTMPEAEGRVRLIAYDISSHQLKPGTYHVFNFSSSDLSFKFGDRSFALRAGRDMAVDHPKWHDKVLAFPLQIAIVTDRQKLVYSSFWEHYPQRRNLFMAFDGFHPSRPIIFSNFNASPPPVKP
jgi:hypothetical protein